MADGMGGYEGGEVASRITVETLMEILQGPLESGTLDDASLENQAADKGSTATIWSASDGTCSGSWMKMKTAWKKPPTFSKNSLYAPDHCGSGQPAP